MLPDQVLASDFSPKAAAAVVTSRGSYRSCAVLPESSQLSCAMLPEQVLASDFAPQAAAAVMRRLSKWAARFIGERGFSIGVDDVIPLPRQVCTIFLFCFKALYVSSIA